MNSPLPLNCTCDGKPLLAYCGRDEKGEPWVHVKAYKRHEIIAEVVVTAGVTKIRCRKCKRWFTVRIVRGAPQLREEAEAPRQIS